MFLDELKLFTMYPHNVSRKYSRMPNWCANTLKVVGNSADVSAFVSENKSEDRALSFNARMPRTPENGVEWGCKWDAIDSDMYLNSDGKSAEYSFTTPWCPPETWLFEVSKMYPTLEFILWFDEESRAFRGETVVKNGVKDEATSYYEDDYEGSEDDNDEEHIIRYSH